MNVQEIWDYSLPHIRRESDSLVGYNTYIKEIRPLSYENGIFKLLVPTGLIKNMVELRYRDIIERAISKITGQDTDIFITVRENQEPEEKKVIEEKPKPQPTNTGLNSNYTFDNFVIGPSNDYAAAMAMRITHFCGDQDTNPLFLYGNSGLGKTHLLHAIGNKILETSPEKKVLYVTSEKFTIDMINSVRDKNMESFRQKYRNLDVLMVDDIQFLEGKEGTLEEFFHTFNDLYMNNKQIVLASDRKPKDFVTLDERLINRFEWGLNIDINLPNYETRVAILKKKAETRNIAIDEDVLAYIAERIDSNIRELEGALSKIISYAGISNREIDIEIADYIIKTILPEDVTVTPDKIMECVASYYKIGLGDLTGTSKQKVYAFPRQIAMYLCKNLTDLNFTIIARIFGGRDRTTVMYAVDKIAISVKEDPNLKRDIENITQEIKNS